MLFRKRIFVLSGIFFKFCNQSQETSSFWFLHSRGKTPKKTFDSITLKDIFCVVYFIKTFFKKTCFESKCNALWAMAQGITFLAKKGGNLATWQYSIYHEWPWLTKHSDPKTGQQMKWLIIHPCVKKSTKFDFGGGSPSPWRVRGYPVACPCGVMRSA